MIRFLLAEAALLGILGTLAGAFLGTVGAYFLTKATSQVLQSEMPDPQLSVFPFLMAIVFGLGISLLGAILPARRAGRLAPAEAMRAIAASEIESLSHVWSWVGLLGIMSGICIHVGCAFHWLSMQWSIPGSIIALLGVVMLLPLLLVPSAEFIQRIIAPILGVEARLAQRQLLRHRGRTTLITSVLFIAISTGIGLACTIIDNVRNVELWCSRALVGDFFVRAAMPDLSTGRAADLPAEFGESLRSLPNVASIDSLRFLSAKAGEQSVIVIVREFNADDQVYFDLMEGEERAVLAGLREGKIVVGSVLAERMKWKRGGSFELETLQGPRNMEICGVVNDYIAGGLTIYMHRPVAEQLFQVEGFDAFIVRAEEGQRTKVGKQVESLALQHGLIFQSNAELVEMIQGLSKGVNGGLWGLLVLGSVIASFGLINTITMNILEQTGEIGLLRVVAMTRTQLRRMVFAQAILLGLIGFTPGAAMGVLLAFLINLSTQSATGHPIEFVFRPGLAFLSYSIALFLAIASSIIPAEQAARLDLPKALRYE